MKKKRTGTRKRPAGGTLVVDAAGAEEAMSGAEPWAPVETKLVVWSFIAAAIALVVFGAIINATILAH